MAKKPTKITKSTKPVVSGAVETPEARTQRCKRMIDEAVALTRCKLVSSVEIVEAQVTSKIQILALD